MEPTAAAVHQPDATARRQSRRRGVLTDKAASYAKPRTTPYKVADGNGLYLLVNPSGSKLWRWKYRFAGKEKLMALSARSPERREPFADRSGCESYTITFGRVICSGSESPSM